MMPSRTKEKCSEEVVGDVSPLLEETSLIGCRKREERVFVDDLSHMILCSNTLSPQL